MGGLLATCVCSRGEGAGQILRQPIITGHKPGCRLGRCSIATLQVRGLWPGADGVDATGAPQEGMREAGKSRRAHVPHREQQRCESRTRTVRTALRLSLALAGFALAAPVAVCCSVAALCALYLPYCRAGRSVCLALLAGSCSGIASVCWRIAHHADTQFTTLCAARDRCRAVVRSHGSRWGVDAQGGSRRPSRKT
jgi:hypothetical protein